MNKEVWWSALDETGLEHLNLRREGQNFVAESTVLKIENGKPFELFYRISIDPEWHVREVEVVLQTDAKQGIKLFADGAGNWTDGATGNELPEFSGCFEIDISATPLTNTLPVKRNELKTGAEIDISVVYFLIPEMSIQRSEQRYSRLENDFYKFEENGLFAGFTADLRFDNDGFVIDYPDLFRQIEFKGEKNERASKNDR